MNDKYYEQAVACVKDRVLPAQMELYRSCCGDLDRIYGEAMNGNGYFGKVIVPGHVYELGYEKCTCPKVLSGQITDPEHCNCSRQSILYILSHQEPDSEFEVDILETILNGAEHCRFRITKKWDKNMSLQLLKAGTSDALTLNEISKRAFDSDVFLGGPSAGGPPGYMSVSFHTEMARQGHLYKLTEDGRIVGGAILFLQDDALNIGRIFIAPEHFRKGCGSFMMQEIESLFPGVKEFTLDTPDWNTRTNSFYTKLGYTEIKRDSGLVYYSKSKEDKPE